MDVCHLFDAPIPSQSSCLEPIILIKDFSINLRSPSFACMFDVRLFCKLCVTFVRVFCSPRRFLIC